MKTTVMGRVRHFLVETAGELTRCTWPSRSELMESTILVIFVTIVLAAFVAAVDAIFRYFMHLITG
ncbi:preprotein translocase subunit SecE [Victivallis sp. Marseille-Q1083]|uniref:preprotein translocase subunit SecE n=1 Tax=Victivallis sp. Marseille-Q1083 TaxID=2717288 RepID=UPI00158B0D59|nr:preprotein translocase subunit SecE [Victivallis sp. Marseille-Q1083]